MGNWTTVHISGSCDENDIKALKEAVNTGDDWDKFHCLCNTGGLCGLGDWVSEDISVVGNLAERGFSDEDILEQVKELIKAAPSLELKIHVGGDYESLDCESTVNCLNGKVTIDKPEIGKIPSIPSGQIESALFKALRK